jgi:hypothetical protein
VTQSVVNWDGTRFGTGLGWPLLAFNGSAAAPSYSFANSPGTGVFIAANNRLQLSTSGVAQWEVNAAGSLIAVTDNADDIGASSTTNRPRNLFLAGNASAAGGTLTLGGDATITRNTANSLLISGNLGVSGTLFTSGGVNGMNTNYTAINSLVTNAHVIAGTSLSANAGIVYFRSDNGVFWQWRSDLSAMQTNVGVWAAGTLVSNDWSVGMPNNFGGGGGAGGTATAVFQFSIYPMRNWADHTGNQNAIVVPNIADNRGQPLAQSWGTWSSAAQKRNVQSIPNALTLIRDDRLHGVTYDNVNERLLPGDVRVPETTPCVGFVADSWLPLVPQIVGTDSSGSAQYMDYSRVSAILWEAVKQLTAAVDGLKGSPV